MKRNMECALLSKDLLHYLASNSKSTGDLWQLTVEYGKVIIEAHGSWRDGLQALEQSAGSLARLMIQLSSYDRMVHQMGHNEYFNQGFGGTPAIGDTTHKILAELHTQFRYLLVPIIGRRDWGLQNEVLSSVHATYNDNFSTSDSNGRLALNPDFGRILEDLSEYDIKWSLISEEIDSQYCRVLEKAIDLSILYYFKHDLGSEPETVG